MQGKRAIATLAEAKAFIVAKTRVAMAPGLPIRLHTADELAAGIHATLAGNHHEHASRRLPGSERTRKA